MSQDQNSLYVGPAMCDCQLQIRTYGAPEEHCDDCNGEGCLPECGCDEPDPSPSFSEHCDGDPKYSRRDFQVCQGCGEECSRSIYYF